MINSDEIGFKWAEFLRIKGMEEEKKIQGVSKKRAKNKIQFPLLCKAIIEPRAKKFWRERSPRLSSVPLFPSHIFFL